MFDLHYWPTPNGKKVTILLEEAGAEYRIVPCNIGRGDQFAPEFAKLNPNTRMPLLVDQAPKDVGTPISVFESGAILLYIAEKLGKFWPQDASTKYDVVQWVIWQMANQGPKTGELGHYKRLGPQAGDQSYAIRRYSNEVNRMYGVLNNRLYDRRYLAGDEYTIADMAAYPWTVQWQWQGEDINEFKYFKRWFEEVGARPGVQRGMVIGDDLAANYGDVTPEEAERRNKLLFNQRARPAPEA